MFVIHTQFYGIKGVILIIKSVLLDRKRYRLAPEVFDYEENLFTIIIGKNGAGKSRLLSKIAKSFIDVKQVNNTLFSTIHKTLSKQVEVNELGREYSIYSRTGSTTSYLGDEDRHTLKIKFKSKLISVTTSPFDKFPVFSKRTSTFKHHDDDRYHYIGLRVSENSYNKSNFLHLLVRSFLKHGINNKQVEVLTLLGYSAPLKLHFKDKIDLYSIKHLKDMSRDNLRVFFLNLLMMNAPAIMNNIRKENNALLDDIISSYIDNYKFIRRGIKIGVNSVSLEGVILLLDVGLIQVSQIYLSSDDETFVKLSDISSGETCILLTILNIAAVIQDNTVICIDEPEISLHPEWQNKFMSLLMSTFEGYKGCHFIISTHSPNVISELSHKNCYILSMSTKNAELVPSTLFRHKSADYQLAELFQSPGSNNEYLNRIVVSLLSTLSKNGKLNKDDKIKAKRLFHLTEKLDDHDNVKRLTNILKLGLEKSKG